MINVIPYEEYKRKYGVVVYENTAYWLTSIPDFSNRVFPNWWGDAEEGESYIAEFSCPAVDASGDRHWIYWQFDDTKGQEPTDLSEYPFDDDHISHVEPA